MINMLKFSVYLIGVEAVVDDGADVVEVQGGHSFHFPGCFLESRQTHVKVDFIQVSAVKSIKLEEKEISVIYPVML